MTKWSWNDDFDSLWTASRQGVITVAQLEQQGVPRQTSAGRCRRSGPWRRLLPGVVLLSNAAPTRRQQILAGLAYAGAPAVLTGLDAAARHGVRIEPPDGHVHILVPHARHRQNRGFVLIERTTRMPDPVDRDGVPLAPAPRAMLDATRQMLDIDAVRTLLAQAVQRRLCSAEELRAELTAGSDRGSALPRHVLAEIADGVGSATEARARQLVLSRGLPPMRWNVTLTDDTGRFLARPDGWADDVALAWEIDSYDYHLSPHDYARTLARHSTMTAAGIVVMHTLPSRLLKEPRVVADELRAAYEHARQRPRPDIRMLVTDAA